MMLMMVAMVMAMAKIFAFRFYISKLPINRLRGRYVTGARNAPLYLECKINDFVQTYFGKNLEK